MEHDVAWSGKGRRDRVYGDALFRSYLAGTHASLGQYLPVNTLRETVKTFPRKLACGSAALDRGAAAQRCSRSRCFSVELQPRRNDPTVAMARGQQCATSRYAPRICRMAQCMMMRALREDAASEGRQLLQEFRALLQKHERWDEWCARVCTRSTCCSCAENAVKAWLWFHRRSVGRLQMVSSSPRATDDPTRTVPCSSDRLHLVLCAMRRSATHVCKGVTKCDGAGAACAGSVCNVHTMRDERLRAEWREGRRRQNRLRP
eukprot:7250132-Prymnesium_polylepis.1